MFFKYTFVTGSRDCTYNHFHSALSIQVLMDIYTNMSSHLFFYVYNSNKTASLEHFKILVV